MGAQRWAFSASSGAQIRFSVLFIRAKIRCSIVKIAQRSVFITASGAWALSDGLLVRHRERRKFFVIYSSKFARMFVSLMAPIGCDRINNRFL